MDVVYLTWEGARLPSSSPGATRLPRRVTCNNTCNKLPLDDTPPSSSESASIWQTSSEQVVKAIQTEEVCIRCIHICMGLAFKMDFGRLGLLPLARSAAPAAPSPETSASIWTEAVFPSCVTFRTRQLDLQTTQPISPWVLYRCICPIGISEHIESRPLRGINCLLQLCEICPMGTSPVSSSANSTPPLSGPP